MGEMHAQIYQALPVAREAGVTIAVENIWNKFFLSPLEMKAFLEQFNDKHVGLYFDTGNVLATGYPEHWIKILGKHIKRVPEVLIDNTSRAMDAIFKLA